MRAIAGQLITAAELVKGDRIILPHRGARRVLKVTTYDEDTGSDPGPRLRIIVEGGETLAFENRASAAKGPSLITLPECTLRPFKPDERVAIERRAA